MPTAGIKFELASEINPKDWTEKLTGAAEKAVTRALYRAAAPLQREMMTRAPVLTGNLRRSISTYPGDDLKTVFVGVPANVEVATRTVKNKETGEKSRVPVSRKVKGKGMVTATSPASAYAHVAERRTGFMAASLNAKKGEMSTAFETELRRVIEGLGRR